MNLTIKRFFSTVLALLIVSFFTIHVSANEVTELDGAKYYIDERINDNDLDFGIKHYTDISYTSATEEQVKHMGIGVNEPFVPGKFYPQQVNVLEVPSSEDIRITPWAIVNQSSWSLMTVRAIISDYEANNPGHKVIAAINGDFFDIRAEKHFPRVPSGVHVSDGHFYKSSASRTIGFKNDGSSKPLVGNESFTRTEKMQLAIYDNKDQIIFNYEIDHINAEPGVGETSIFFANFLEHLPVPIEVSDGYIIEDAEYALPIAANDFYGLGTISKIGEETLGEGQFALVSKDPLLTERLALGIKVRAQFEFSGEYADIKDAVGAGETLLYNGELKSTDTNRHPRTMIGMKEDGTIIMTVVDGRQPDKNMYGASGAEMATILKHYGAVEGYNLDGGGSSTMVIRKNGLFEVMNSPSDGGERSDANGIMISVKVPIIDYELTDITTSGFTVKPNIIDKNGFAIDKLYVGLDGENITEVVNGKAVFSNLNQNQNFTLNFYEKIDGKFRVLTLEEAVNTAKQMPNPSKLNINYAGNDLIIQVEIDDLDNAIVSSSLYVNGNFVAIIDNVATYRNFSGPIEYIYITHRCDLNDGTGRFNLEETNMKISANYKIFMGLAEYKISSLFTNLYK